jgi:N-acetylmuramoyl-L-alanine amidase
MLQKIATVSLVALSAAFSCNAACIGEICSDLSESGIRVQQKALGGLPVYAIEEFSGKEANRNHWDDRVEGPVRFLVMHYTVCNFPTTLDLFTRNIDDGRASAHYVISQKEEHVQGGVLMQVVPEDKRSWHAGVSFWRGKKNLNHESIGIENVNQGFVGDEAAHPTWFPFDPDQIKTLGALSANIVERYGIQPENVVGHADIAPGRKQDPGIFFPWEELHTKYGVGAWLSQNEKTPEAISGKYFPKEPLPQGVSDAFFLQCLRNYGYSCPEGGQVTPEHHGAVKAFKSHFSHNQDADAYTPEVDKEAMLWVWGLDSKYPKK